MKSNVVGKMIGDRKGGGRFKSEEEWKKGKVLHGSSVGRVMIVDDTSPTIDAKKMVHMFFPVYLPYSRYVLYD